jgi:hypothetical protein
MTCKRRCAAQADYKTSKQVAKDLLLHIPQPHEW